MAKFNFKEWRTSLNFTKTDAAKALGISVGSVSLYEAGKRFDNGKPVVVPKTVELACLQVSATEHGIAERDKLIANLQEVTYE